jgi:hypothetical protein
VLSVCYSPKCLEQEFSEVRSSKRLCRGRELLRETSRSAQPSPLTAPHRHKRSEKT